VGTRFEGKVLVVFIASSALRFGDVKHSASNVFQTRVGAFDGGSYENLPLF
jgi:hypothetical protein